MSHALHHISINAHRAITKHQLREIGWKLPFSIVKRRPISTVFCRLNPGHDFRVTPEFGVSLNDRLLVDHPFAQIRRKNQPHFAHRHDLPSTGADHNPYMGVQTQLFLQQRQICMLFAGTITDWVQYTIKIEKQDQPGHDSTIPSVSKGIFRIKPPPLAPD